MNNLSYFKLRKIEKNLYKKNKNKIYFNLFQLKKPFNYFMIYKSSYLHKEINNIIKHDFPECLWETFIISYSHSISDYSDYSDQYVFILPLVRNDKHVQICLKLYQLSELIPLKNVNPNEYLEYTYYGYNWNDVFYNLSLKTMEYYNISLNKKN